VAEPAGDAVDDALEELVNQFSDPLSFLRELVQNSIDAGSHEIEISTTFEPKGDAGVAVIEVSDWGGGMTREIIETKLTRLFSSQKDGDRTKIGKFGIGFVSVFAIAPDVVCVDTARDGEAWRVLFDAKRAFKLVRLDEPVEGTRIRVFKTMSEAEFDGFAGRVRKTVKYWCKHAECDIRVDGDSIAVPFPFDAPCSVESDDGYSRIAASHRLDHRTFLGLYNGGLTLIERSKSVFEDVAVRAWSPHLEHTLTRDAVIEDAGYERVMKGIRDTVSGPLAERSFEALEAELHATLPTPMRRYLQRCVRWHLAHGMPSATRSAVGRRTVALTASGQRLTLDRLEDGVRDDVVLLARERGPLSDAVEATGLCVAHGGLETAEGLLLGQIGRGAGFGVEELSVRWALPLPLREGDDHGRLGPLAAATLALFKDAGHKVSEVHFGHFDYPGANLAAVVAISQRTPFALTPLSEIQTLGEGFFSRSRPIVVNIDHPTTRAVVSLAERDLALAAYMLAKLFFVGNGLTPAMDGTLAASAARLSADGGAR